MKRYRRWRVWMTAALVVAGMLLALTPAGLAQGIRLRVADSFPPSHYQSKDGIVVWMNRVTELTGGRVQFDYFPAQQLGSVADMLDLVQTRVADIAYVGPNYFSDRMPLSGVAELPGSFTTSQEGTEAYWRLVERFLLEHEFLANDVRPLYAVTLPPYQLATLSKRINSLADLQGLRIFAGGASVSQTVQRLGGVPTSIPAPELYLAMQRGMLDGAVGAIGSIKPYNLHELVRHMTTNLNLGSFVATYVINEQVWQRLPADVQAAMIQAGEETRRHLSRVLDEADQATIEELSAAGVDLYRLPEDELARWTERVRPVWDEWAASLDRRGLPGSQVLSMWLESVAEGR
ncbi:MAG TPA: TRAP transporter substrate-binding protein DctP [Limnochordales bacterium]